MKKIISGNNKFVIGIAAAVLMFAAIGFVSFEIMNDDIDAGNKTARSYEIINSVNNIQNRLKDLGLMRRGLMLTGDNSLLENHQGITIEIKNESSRLEKLTSYDPQYADKMHTASVMTSRRLVNFRNSIDIYMAKRTFDNFQYTYTVVGKPISKLNNIIYERIKEQEEKNIQISSADENQYMLLTKFLLIAGNLSAFFILVYSILRLKRYNKLILDEIELRKFREAELIEKQLEIEKLSDLSPVGIFHLDAHLKFDFANGTMAKMTGYCIDELLQMDIYSLINDEDRRGFLKEWNKPLNENANFSGEFRLTRKNSQSMHVIGEFARQIDTVGNVTGYICSLTDITKLHEYQEELVKYNRLFEGITEGIPDPIMVKDSRGAYEYVNTAGAEFIGKEKEDIIGKTDSDLLSSKIAEEISIKEDSILSSGNSINYEIRAVHPDGTLKTFLSTKGVLRNSKNRIIGLFGIARDVTQLKKKEEEISRSLKEKETLLKEIHHRVKNNLQIVVSLLRLQSSYIKDPESKKYFLDSQNRIRSMAVVHEKLYGSTSLADIDLNLYLCQLVNDLVYSLDIDTSRIEILTDIDSLKIDLDHAIPVGLIVNEILTNSFKYAFPGSTKGKIIIKAAENDGHIKIELSDNGIGLPKNKSIRDFDSLGLQLVQTLAESQLDGNISMHNSGKGVHLNISFPYIVQECKS